MTDVMGRGEPLSRARLRAGELDRDGLGRRRIERDEVLTGDDVRDRRHTGLSAGTRVHRASLLERRHLRGAAIRRAGAVKPCQDESRRPSRNDLERDGSACRRVCREDDLGRRERRRVPLRPDLGHARVLVDGIGRVRLRGHVYGRFRVAGELDDVRTRVASRRYAVALELGRTIAVVVVRGEAHLFRRRMDVAVRVVAVAGEAFRARRERHRDVAEAVVVAVATFVGCAVAVVVDAVAGFGRTRVDARLGVVAVSHRASRTRIVCHRDVAPVVAVVIATLIGCAVAVVVEAVAGLGRGLGHVRTGRTGGTLPVGRAHERSARLAHAASGGTSSAECEVLVDRGVAVVVESVAGFGDVHRGLARALHTGRVGLTGPDAVLAQVRVRAVTRHTEREGFVDLAVAVVVESVAGFGRTRVDARLGVVAIVRRETGPSRLIARLHRDVAAMPVGVVVGVERVLDPFVDRSVAVVVETVAGFDHGRSVVLTGRACAVRRALERTVLARIRVRAVAGIAERREVFVDRSVAVVVLPVAGFGDVHRGLVDALVFEFAVRARVRPLLALVAVAAVARLAERKAFVHRAVAVVVLPIAGFGHGLRHVALRHRADPLTRRRFVLLAVRLARRSQQNRAVLVPPRAVATGIGIGETVRREHALADQVLQIDIPGLTIAVVTAGLIPARQRCIVRVVAVVFRQVQVAESVSRASLALSRALLVAGRIRRLGTGLRIAVSVQHLLPLQRRQRAGRRSLAGRDVRPVVHGDLFLGFAARRQEGQACREATHHSVH